jgi:transcriptional/translational regulatory protein YebC/TACO1
MEAAIEAGADDVESDAEGHTIYTAFEDLGAVAEALDAKFGAPKSTEVIWRPKSTIPVSGDQAGSLMKLMDALDDDDDVQNVFANFEMSEEDMARLAG